MGQFVQEGSKVLFETILTVKEPLADLEVPFEEGDIDELNYLAGKSLDWVNQKAYEGTLEAHVETGKVPNIILEIEKLDAYNFGYMVYFFFKALAMSVYMLDVNPFDQPGVEVYKRNMFRLLGKK
ncbi:MAG: glucose-6-phosphate isomerase, partial [Erysipelothrix sp.]|nr:glucose-6-phosphate isomerase [Erysipelothrix sp.]